MRAACLPSAASLEVKTAELDHTPDLVDLVSAARDAGHEVALIERSVPDAVSIAGIGRRFDLVSTESGAAIEDHEGRMLVREQHPDRLVAASRLWTALTTGEVSHRQPSGTGLVAMGGFAFDPSRDPAGPWAGFPAILFRVPALAVTRIRGRTYATGDLDLLEQPSSWRGPAARRLEVGPVRPEADWVGAVADLARRLRRGEADKVVLAREIMVHADGVVAAGAVARALRNAYPACFTYLMAGADGTAFAGASPELLLRRTGGRVTSQPMAGSTARGDDEDEDEALAAQLRASTKDEAEHHLTASHVATILAGVCQRVEVGQPEIVRFTNIQHLATTLRGDLRPPWPNLLELAAVLHPTPAINGSPAGTARRLISELEDMERGWYAGAVGWLDARGDGELAVAIRCGLLYQDGARLYAGNGMMPDSDPEAELRETELKLKALLGALSG